MMGFNAKNSPQWNEEETVICLRSNNGIFKRSRWIYRKRREEKRGKIRKSAIPNHQIMIAALNERDVLVEFLKILFHWLLKSSNKIQQSFHFPLCSKIYKVSPFNLNTFIFFPNIFISHPSILSYDKVKMLENFGSEKKSFTSPSLFTLLKHIWKNKYHRQQYISIVWLFRWMWVRSKRESERYPENFKNFHEPYSMSFFGVVCCSKEEEEGERKIWNYVLSWCSGEVLSKKEMKKKLDIFVPTPRHHPRDSRDVDGAHTSIRTVVQRNSLPSHRYWVRERRQ